MESINQSPREEIKELLIESLSQKLLRESGEAHTRPAMTTIVESHAEQMLFQFEQRLLSNEIRAALATSKSGFWRGVSESILGSFLFLFVIGATILAWQGYQFNFWQAILRILKIK